MFASPLSKYNLHFIFVGIHFIKEYLWQTLKHQLIRDIKLNTFLHYTSNSSLCCEEIHSIIIENVSGNFFIKKRIQTKSLCIISFNVLVLFGISNVAHHILSVFNCTMTLILYDISNKCYSFTVVVYTSQPQTLVSQKYTTSNRFIKTKLHICISKSVR